MSSSAANVMSKVEKLRNLIAKFIQQLNEDSEEDFPYKINKKIRIFISSLGNDAKMVLNTPYINPKEKYGGGWKTPCSTLMYVLHCGIADGFREEIKLMLKAGADVNERVTIEQVDTPLEFFIKFPPGYDGLHLEDVKPFIEHGAKITPRALKLAKELDERSGGVGSVDIGYGKTTSLVTYLTKAKIDLEISEAKIDQEISEMKSVDEIIAKLKARFPGRGWEDLSSKDKKNRKILSDYLGRYLKQSAAKAV